MSGHSTPRSPAEGPALTAEAVRPEAAPAERSSPAAPGHRPVAAALCCPVKIHSPVSSTTVRPLQQSNCCVG